MEGTRMGTRPWPAKMIWCWGRGRGWVWGCWLAPGVRSGVRAGAGGWPFSGDRTW